MNLKTLSPLFTGWLCLVFCLPVWGLDSDRQQPLKILADTATIDEKDGLATYTGNVILTQGTLKILADKLTIKSRSGKVSTVKALGDPAQFSQTPSPDQPEVVAKAKAIDYQVKQQTLLLRRRASIIQADNIFRGEEILYELQSQRLQAQGQAANPQPGDIKGRVEMILPAERLTEDNPPPPSEHSTEDQ